MTTISMARHSSGPARAARDTSFSPSFVRQVVVELRKMVDTISGVVLLVITAALVVIASVALIGLGAIVPELGAPSFGTLLTGSTGATAILLPVLGIMAITSEWSQRTLLTTFTLEPRRMRVLAAKLVSGIVIALGAMALALVWTAIATPLGALVLDQPAVWDVTSHELIGSIAVQVIGVLSGMALAVLILNTPAAICAYVGYAFVLPMVIGILSLWEPVAKIAPWIDFVAAQDALTAPMAGADWGHLLTSGGIWFVLPLVLGCIRVQRAEVS